jgi:acetyl-CoA acetyltransferase
VSEAAYIYGAVRTPFGRYGGALAKTRPDDLAAGALKALLDRVPDLDPGVVDDVLLGNANGAGEDNRDVARMAVLLAGLPTSVPGATVNRLCGSSLEAGIQAARAIETGDAEVIVAGGVESMSRAEVVPVPGVDLDRYEGIRADSTLEALSRLKPAFVEGAASPPATPRR